MSNNKLHNLENNFLLSVCLWCVFGFENNPLNPHLFEMFDNYYSNLISKAWKQTHSQRER